MTSLDKEANEIIEFLDKHNDFPYPKPASNAYVFIDSFGRLSILLEKGGWLGADLAHVQGDIAPYAG